MKLIPNIDGEKRNVLTYDLGDGRYARLDAMAVREHGAAKVLHHMGLMPDPAALPRKHVFQHGKMVGTVPGAFDPHSSRSRSPLYDIRPGDFVEQDGGWKAHQSLGPGDLMAIEGFRPA